jgi:hypothetical protein
MKIVPFYSVFLIGIECFGHSERNGNNLDLNFFTVRVQWAEKEIKRTCLPNCLYAKGKIYRNSRYYY